jgi:two-component system LytT family sensor kinase
MVSIQGASGERSIRAVSGVLALTAVWSIPALAGTINGVLFMRAAGIHGTAWDAAAVEFPGWLFWVPATLLIVRLAARFPVVPLRLANVGVHLGTGAVLSVLRAVVVAVSYRLDTPQVPFLAADRDIGFELVKFMPLTLLIYAAVLGVSYAQQYRRRAALLSEQLSAAQLTALRAQFQPHVMFNSLNAAIALVRSRNLESAEHVLLLLSDVLRTVVRADPAQEVTLAQELSFVERCLEIERIRFGSRLQVSVSAPPDLRDALVPNLILQPLVENAIQHGVAAADHPSHVEIAVHGEDNRLVIVVRNDGSLLQMEREGLGLSSTRARLAQLYGDRASFAMSTVQAGVEVRLDLPLRVKTAGGPSRVLPVGGG